MKRLVAAVSGLHQARQGAAKQAFLALPTLPLTLSLSRKGRGDFCSNPLPLRASGYAGRRMGGSVLCSNRRTLLSAIARPGRRTAGSVFLALILLSWPCEAALSPKQLKGRSSIRLRALPCRRARNSGAAPAQR